jgi:hypothetical protein
MATYGADGVVMLVTLYKWLQVLLPVWHGYVVWNKEEWNKKSSAWRFALGVFQHVTHGEDKRCCQSLRNERVYEFKFDQSRKLITLLICSKGSCELFPVLQKMLIFEC